MNFVLVALLATACADGADLGSSGFGPQTAPTTMTTTPPPSSGSATSTTAPTTGETDSTDGTDGTGNSDGPVEPTSTTDTATTAVEPTSTSSSTTDPSTSAGTEACPEGTIGCACYGNNTCNDGLACEGGTCVPVADPVCGDGMLAGMEECDNGAENADTASCKSDCTLQVCGDGFVGPGEACDDGNEVDNDACSNACIAASCGDLQVQIGEDCDDGNMVDTDACINCQAAACGDTFVQAGVEECDDGNVVGGDGCSAGCKVEVPQCGGNFTTGWCLQNGTNQQYTRCESVSNNNKTCNNPFVKYGSVENGVPASHGGNNFTAWCTQLGFAGFSGQVTYGSRPCAAPQGKLFGCTSYDEGVWHWCDWQDGYWLNQQLNYYNCNDGQEITSITCL